MPDVETSSISINITAEDNASESIESVKKKLESFGAVIDKLSASWAQLSSQIAGSGFSDLTDAVKTVSSADFSSIDLSSMTDGVNGATAAFAELTGEMQTFSTDSEHAFEIWRQGQQLTNMREMTQELEEAGKPLTLMETAADEIVEKTETMAEKVEEVKQAASGTATDYDKMAESAKKVSEEQDNATKSAKKAADSAKESSSALSNFFSGIGDARTKQMSADMAGLATSIGKAITPLAILKTTADITGKIWQFRFKLVKATITGTISAIKKLATATAGLMKATAKISFYIGKAFGKVALAPINAMAKAIGNVANRLKTMFAGLIRIATYRLFRTMIKMITQGLNEGITALYQWSKALDQSFSKAMDLFATDRQYLNNSLAASLEPIIEKVIPILDQAVDKTVDLLNKFNQFASALAGKSVWTKALKVPAEYQEKAEEATKETEELKRSLLGFDEINRLDGDNDKSSSKEKSEKDYSNMFEELPITGVFADMAKKIRERIESGQWYEAGKALAEKLNELIEIWEPEKAGKILATKINEIVDFARGFITTANWQTIGEKIAGTINSFLYGLNSKNIGKLIANVFNGAFKIALGFMRKIDGKQIGKTLSSIFNGFFETIDVATIGDTISTTLSKALDIGISYFENLNKNAFYDSILGLLDNIKFGDIGLKLSELLNAGISVIDSEKIGAILSKTLSGIADFVTNSVGNLNIADLVTAITGTISNMLTDTATITKVAKGFETLLKGAITAVGTFISTFHVNELFEAITTFFEGIDWEGIGASIGESIRGAIDNLNPETIGNAISTVITKAIDLLSAFNEKMDMTGWQKLGYDIGAAIATALNGIKWDKAGDTLSNLAMGLITAISTAIKTADANGELTTSINELMGSINWAGIAQGIIDILHNHESILWRAIKELGKAFAQVLWDGIKDGLTGAGEAIEATKSKAPTPKTPIPSGDIGGLPSQLPNGYTPYVPSTQAQAAVNSATTTATASSNITEAVAAGVAEGERRANENATGGSNVSVSVDGDNLFNFFVKKHNSTVKQTGVTPLYV